MTLFATHEIGHQRHMTKWAARIVVMFLFNGELIHFLNRQCHFEKSDTK